jgi:hypothetical protein
VHMVCDGHVAAQAAAEKHENAPRAMMAEK